MKILIVDNYDSFTYNLAGLINAITGKRPAVERNDTIDLDTVSDYDKILLSPGPGVPGEAGRLIGLIEAFAPSKSILGVCLGHQAIGQVFGAQLHNVSQVYHGVSTPVRQLQQDVLFKNMDTVFDAGRYHSWVVDKKDFPESLAITAEDEQGYIMALRHQTYDVRGIQFHPESILTSQGRQIMTNWIDA